MYLNTGSNVFFDNCGLLNHIAQSRLMCVTMLATMTSRARPTSELLQGPQALFVSLSFVLLICAYPGEACISEGVGVSLLCRACGHELAFEGDAKFLPSRLALSHRNDTVLGDRIVPVQLFENPQGYQFEVMTFTRADVAKHWPADKHFSWYPGYSWAIATCRRCHTHLGWAFQPNDWPKTVTEKEFEQSENTFFALITNRLLREDFASSLLITPKSFRT